MDAEKIKKAGKIAIAIGTAIATTTKAAGELIDALNNNSNAPKA